MVFIKYAFFCTLILVLPSVKAWSQDFVPRTYTSALMYRISGKGLARPSYIYASLHSMPCQYVQQKPRFIEIAQSVDCITTEINIDSMKRWTDSLEVYGQHLFQEIKPLITLPETEWIQHVAPEKYHYIDSIFQRYCVVEGIDDWEHLNMLAFISVNPLLLVNKVATVVTHEVLGLPRVAETIAIDTYMYTLADSLGKEKAQLESLEYQNSLLFGADFKNIKMDSMRANLEQLNLMLGSGTIQSETLYVIAQTLDCELYTDIVSITAAYVHQDGIATSLLLAQSDNGALAQRLQLQARNNRWLPLMTEMIQAKPTLFVVGLSHLFDDCGYPGVLHLLENEGYTIEAVRL